MSARPTLRQLEYFVAVAKHLHFGRAARSVAVSQPALSAQIRQLEELLGVKLFERNRRRVLITSEGAKLAVAARRVLRATDDLVELALPRNPLEGTLRLGVIPTVAPYLLPRVLPGIRDRYPDMRLILIEDQTAPLVGALQRGELDVSVLALPVAEVSAGLASVVLWRERFVLLCPEGHPLAARARVRLPELLGTTMLLLEDGHCLRDHALDICGAVGALESEDIQAKSMTTLVQMVESGLGCTLLPESARAVELGGTSRLVLREFEDPAPSRKIGMAWRRTSHHEAAFEELAEAITRELSESAAPTLGPLRSGRR